MRRKKRTSYVEEGKTREQEGTMEVGEPLFGKESWMKTNDREKYKHAGKEPEPKTGVDPPMYKWIKTRP